MKKLLSIAALVVLGGGLAAPAFAEPPDPNKNIHGLCTAYFSGNKNGWKKNGTPPPFRGLEDAVPEDYDGDGDDDRDDVYAWCRDNDPKFRK